MTDLQKVKISISVLITLGVAKSQKELGLKMGYENESSFSQIINGKVPIPNNFIKRLRSLDNRLDDFWSLWSEGNNSSNKIDDTRKLEKENKELMAMVIDLQKQLLDKSLYSVKDTVNDK